MLGQYKNHRPPFIKITAMVVLVDDLIDNPFRVWLARNILHGMFEGGDAVGKNTSTLLHILIITQQKQEIN